VLVVFQQVEWHSFVYSSSCGCLLSWNFVTIQNVKVQTTLVFAGWAKTDGKIGD
jgi:hypothetical protein